MPHPLRATCFNCGTAIDASPATGDGYAVYTSDVEFFSADGRLEHRSLVRRLVCTDCGEFAEDHPVRFPSPLGHPS